MSRSSSSVKSMTWGEPTRTFKTANKNATFGGSEDGSTDVVVSEAQVEQEGLVEAAEPYAMWKSLPKLKNAAGSHSRVSSPEAELTADFRDCYICEDFVQIKRKRDWH
jgi:hypothetical protein